MDTGESAPMIFNLFKSAKAIRDTREYQLRCIKNWYAFFELVIKDGMYYAKFNSERPNSIRYISECYDDGDALIGHLYYTRRGTVWDTCNTIEGEKNDIR